MKHTHSELLKAYADDCTLKFQVYDSGDEKTQAMESAVRTVVAQNVATVEVRAVKHACMMVDGWRVLPSSMDDLVSGIGTACDAIRGGGLPVGSVEFVREAMRVCKFEPPVWSSYPDILGSWMHRQVRLIPAAQAKRLTERCFVKPFETKLFTGFVWVPGELPTDEAGMESWLEFGALGEDEMVWVSEVVEWLCEWRCYIQDGVIEGKARYDCDGLDEAQEPDWDQVGQMIERMESGASKVRAYTLDVGVISSGETCLVEANDFWSIGLYDNCMKPQKYLELLTKRWDEVRARQ